MGDPTTVPLYLPAPTGAGPWALEFTNGTWQLVALSTVTVLAATTQAAPTITQALLDLGPVPRRGGRAVLEGTFTEAQVGRPVLMTHAHSAYRGLGPEPGIDGQTPNKSLDELESAQADFAACVIDTRHMVVRWNSSGAMHGMVRVNYVIGS